MDVKHHVYFGVIQHKNRQHSVLLQSKNRNHSMVLPIQKQSIQSGVTQCKNKTLSGVTQCKIENTEWLYWIQEQRDQWMVLHSVKQRTQHGFTQYKNREISERCYTVYNREHWVALPNTKTKIDQWNYAIQEQRSVSDVTSKWEIMLRKLTQLLVFVQLLHQLSLHTHIYH